MRLFFDAASLRTLYIRTFGLLGAFLVAASLSACASNKDEIIPPDEPAEKIYNEGLTLMNKGDLAGAEIGRAHV